MEALSSAIFTKLNDKKLGLISTGKEVIDFSIGTSDIPPDKQFVEKLQYETGKIENYKYGISDSEELISAVIKWYKTRYNVELEKDEVTTLLGSQSGFAEVTLSMLDPGDVVLTQDPGYPIFSVGPYLAGAKIPSKYESSMKFTLDLMEKTGVIVVPGSSFGDEGEGFVRMALVQDEEHILKAIESIRNSDIL